VDNVFLDNIVVDNIILDHVFVDHVVLDNIIVDERGIRVTDPPPATARYRTVGALPSRHDRCTM
jgi:hypothetical protein